MSQMVYRAAGPEDVATLAALRWEMQLDAGVPPQGARDAYIATYVTEMRAEFASGRTRAWLAEANGTAVASVTLISWVVPPAIGYPVRRRGQVSNVFTLPAYRRQGIAQRLMRELLDYARAHHIHRVVLWASAMGQPMYESLGFGPGQSMEIRF